MQNVLSLCYEKALNGLPTSKKVADLGEHYLTKYSNKESAAKHLINAQIAKCTTSGFVTGLGGLVTLPVTVPVNVTSVLYVQLRMIASIAYIGGYNPADDEVQTLAYLCLTGTAISDVVKGTGIKIGQKVAVNALKKLPGKVLTKINQKVGFRLVTKFGEKGAVNLVKLVPGVGGVIGGAFDFAGTKIIAQKAYNMFINGVIE
ncbi:MAG: EcsC family protein [Oscillospiraceae bacterium]|nr:EcsC family protein [Oscillospiraceae bacterium]